ncbi:MAG: chaperone required for assembly of F1-ATPase [Paracoccaceae bacterium]
MKRFYKSVGIAEEESGFSVRLDNRPVKTPAKNQLLLPNRPLADAVAAEWEEQPEDIDAHSMRLTRLANSTIDRVIEHRLAVIAEVAGFAGTDLVCYRAAEPASLAKRQEEGWGALVSWVAERHGIDLAITTSLLPVAQSDASAKAVQTAIEAFDEFSLAGLHLVTSACGSVVLGLAVADNRIDGATAFELSLIDETFQIEEWGEEPEATKRRAGLLEDITAADTYLRLCKAVH